MIITQISGGLGNQLFQYAAGKALALYHNTDLKLDYHSTEVDTLRGFQLDAFNFSLDFANEAEKKRYQKIGITNRFINILIPASKQYYYKEPFFHFDTDFFKHPLDCYLKGYWQSEKYFSAYRSSLLNDFVLKSEKVNNVVHFEEEIQKSASVAVHIRRGDYANKAALDYHGILTEAYYKKAIEFTKRKIDNPSFYFFSDDIDYVKKYFNQENCFFVSGSVSNTHFEDLYLMSKCQNNIIANSSFSWWGAWLNNNPDKIVIAPGKWFNNGPSDTQDLLPPNWVII